ncbi:MAG: phosphoribosylformylglycinamidine cyclo-ligase [Deltaproteobacteria bacterium]|nr:phosphoribosylformylglycinamidine cyclo-ligase [Deltaproteobacteria bacterium]
MAGMTYRGAGVDIEAGESLVERIKPLAAATRIPEVLSSIGGFAGLCGLPKGLEEPILVSGTDGVGTKLKVAFATGVHDTVGIDLVAMCVNDVLTTGARPLFFLDYFATGSVDVEVGAAVVRGIAEGCKQSGCALLGGETAELPGFYADGEYDLAGFAVGVVDKKKLVDPARVEAGDVILGVASSGLHSNGFSLARKALLEGAGLDLDAHVESLGDTLGRTLLTPTRIYAEAVEKALAIDDGDAVHALCHVTGGGLPGNLPRVLPDGLGADVQTEEVPTLPIFGLVRDAGGVAEDEMRRTFNMGVGLVIVVNEARAEQVRAAAAGAGDTVFTLGRVEAAAGATGEARVRYRS